MAEVSRQASLALALIGNCTVNALIDAQARIVWCCLPRPDADPVFHALLDSVNGIGPDGCMSVELEGMVQSTQQYEAGTAIVRTRMFDAQGAGIEVVDFAPRYRSRDRMFRPAQLVRRVRTLAGHPRVRFVVRPRSNWGATAPVLT
ncbi:MAG: trehalase-like domain-containing protein, partial [Rhodoferax sp.]